MLELVQRHGAVIGMEKQANNRVNSDCQKRRAFRYATSPPLLAAGYAKR